MLFKTFIYPSQLIYIIKFQSQIDYFKLQLFDA